MSYSKLFCVFLLTVICLSAASASPTTVATEHLGMPMNETASEGIFVQLETTNVILGEEVVIYLYNAPEHVHIDGPNATFRFLGEPISPSFFSPKDPGRYVIVAGDTQREQRVEFTVTEGQLQEDKYREFNRISHDNPLITIKDAQGRVLVKKSKQVLNQSSAFAAISNASERMTVLIEPEDNLFASLELNEVDVSTLNVRINKPNTFTIQKQLDLPKKTLTTYALDPTQVDFTTGTLSKRAQGTELYKCAEWHFDTQSCLGSWIKLRDITPGTVYSIPIDPADPAFAETGVATINAKKAYYEPGEEATILVAVLDTQGFLVSEANITAEVLSPSNTSAEYSTDTTVIEVSDGIYEFVHTSSEEGVHKIFVHASGPGVDTAMMSNYTVSGTYAYDIIRETPMSIDPWKGPYKTSFVVQPHTVSNMSNETITITERIPAEISVVDAGGGTVSTHNNFTHISWITQTGDLVSYYAQAPLVTPDLHAIGPATVQGLVNFSESRLWWLAVDPTNTLDPIVHVNTEVGGTDLSTAQVTAISSDDIAYVTFTKNTVLTVEVSDPTNSTPIANVTSLSCSVRYTSETYSPAATFRVDEAFGGNALGSTTLAASPGVDATVTLNNLQADGDFDEADLTTLNIYIRNNDGGSPQTISIDDVWCTVSYIEADLTNPTVTLNEPTDPEYFSIATVQFNYTPVDNVGFDSCDLLINGTTNETNATAIVNGSVNSITETFGEGSYTWNVQCTDTSSNTGAGSPTRDFWIDLTDPTSFSLSAPTNDTISTDLTPTFTWSATSDFTFHNYSLLLDNNIDFSSPNYVRETTLSASNTSYTFPTIITANTQYYWKVIAEDLVGRQTESSQVFVYTTDTVAPTQATLLSPASTTISANRTPFLDWTTITETNFDNYTIQFDDASDFSSVNHEYSVPTRISSQFQIVPASQLGVDTTFFWRVIAYDEAGQSSTSSSFTYTTDNTGPGITPQTPIDYFNETVSNTLEFNYTVTDVVSAVSSCELIVNGTSEQTDVSITEGITQTFNEFLSNGYYEWWVNCTDTVGNEAESTHRFLNVSVTTDTTPPVITLQYPSSSAHVDASTIQFNYTPQDATGILNCSLYIDGSLNTSNTSVNNNVINHFTIGVFSEQVYNWSVACYDNSTSENFGSSSTYVFTVDTTPPSAVTLISLTNNTATADNTPLLNWSPTTETNFDNYTIFLDTNNDFSSPEYVFTNNSLTQTAHTTTALADGVYYWKVTSYDLAGNSQDSTQTYVFTIDTSAPTYQNIVENPATPIQYNPTRTYNFSINATDQFLDTVLLEHNFNVTPVNVTANIGDVFWYALTGIAAGSHSYRWFMNDTLGNENMTTQFSYTITQNTTTTTLYLDSQTNNLTINESQIVNITGLLNWPATGNVQLRENGSLLNQSTSPVYRLKNYTTPGYYEINASYAGSTNYASSRDTLYLTVNDIFAPSVQLTTPANATTDDDGIVAFGYMVSDTNTIDNCSLYIDGGLNQTTVSPVKDSELFFNVEFPVDQNITWDVTCYDIANLAGTSETRDLEIDIAIYSLNLVPLVCADQATCIASNINVSDTNWDEHGTLQKAPSQNNYVYANLSNPNIPLGSSILDASIYWEKYQATTSGTFFLSWRNGSNWDVICSQAFTSSSTASPDPLGCNFTSFPLVAEWNGPLQLRANFLYTGNPSGVAFGSQYVEVNVTYQEDTTDPSVELTEPTDEFETGAGTMVFNITATDVNLENCTLYGDFSGIWQANSTITINDNLTSDSLSSFLPVELSVGYFEWNAYCIDIAGNAAFASQNFSVNITPPDLTVTANDIFFQGPFYENATVTLFATIFNIGFTTAENFIVQFFLGDPDSGGVQINGNQTVTSLAYNENATINVSYISPIGPSTIFVAIDRANFITETDEANNKDSTVLNINAYNRLYGNTTINITLDTSNNSSLIEFVSESNNTGNLFFVRGGSSISFANLIPLGKTTADLNTSDDFSEADALLNMTGFNDSINARWANLTDRPINVTTLVIDDQIVDEIPIVASDDDADFITGILWDSQDDVDADTEYDAADAEDLVFVANAQSGLTGSFGIQAYEALIPARLREYGGGPVEMVEIYFELT